MLFTQDNMCKNKNPTIKYMPLKLTKSMRSKLLKRRTRNKIINKTRATNKTKKTHKRVKKLNGKSRKVILTKGKHTFKRTRKQKGGSLFPETNLMLQNLSEKTSATQNIIEGSQVPVSGKDWVQPELTKY